MKYRKKPVVVEAIQLRWDTWNEMCDWVGVGKLEDGKPQGIMLPEGKCGLHIPTLEGLMLGSEGDWIIKGIKGEIYPVKPDIFAATYESANMEETINTTLEPGMTAFKNSVSVTNYSNSRISIVISTPKVPELPVVDFDYDEQAETKE